jgi:BirA family biotin operon repressor/biotin-[acetyl-CoA-carboxylase] ligase
MDEKELIRQLADLPIPHIRYFDTIGSTNDEALTWAAEGAEDGCLVAADQQTQGRGRFQRRWITRPGTALAFSLILHPTPAEMKRIEFFSPLGALAISQALEGIPGLNPLIKWPNDVLLQRRKAAGILVEAAWVGDHMQGMVIGVGLNVAPQSVPPADEVLFPAISVEEVSGHSIDRVQILHAILKALFTWRVQIGTEAFQQAWEQRLAFRDEWVRIDGTAGEPITGQVVGIDPKGSLLLRNTAGEITAVMVGDVHLRLME